MVSFAFAMQMADFQAKSGVRRRIWPLGDYVTRAPGAPINTLGCIDGKTGQPRNLSSTDASALDWEAA